MDKKGFFRGIICMLCAWQVSTAQAKSIDEFERLKIAYPNHIEDVSFKYVAWKDGKRMLIRGDSSLLDHLASWVFKVDPTVGSIAKEDVLRDGYEPLFRKMYGGSPDAVKRNLVTIYWMPKVFGKQYPLKVTTINGVAEKLARISSELEKLPPSYYKYLANPAGSFYWRKVAGERYLSSHSFGIAMDINSHYSNYWLWDFQRSGRPITELTYQNQVPLKIVQIFEKEGFFWGGHWHFYDTMHFEYRPDLFVNSHQA